MTEAKRTDAVPLSRQEFDFVHPYLFYYQARNARRNATYSNRQEDFEALDWNVAKRIENIAMTVGKHRGGKLFFTTSIPTIHTGEKRSLYYVAVLSRDRVKGPEMMSKVIESQDRRDPVYYDPELIKKIPGIELSDWASDSRITDAIVDSLLFSTFNRHTVDVIKSS